MALGLTLMLIGMLTVFVIMFLIILIIQGLISVVNRVAPEATAPKKQAAQAAAVDALTMSVIADAVRQITGGEGKVTSVEKIQ